MKTEVEVPEVGESVTEGTITSWLKKDGEFVSEGDDLFELETDKATLSIPSPASGVLSIVVQEGSEVNVGQVVASLETDKKQKKTPPQKAEISKSQPQQTQTVTEPLSPAVRRLVNEHALQPEEIAGTGKDGRITKKDVLEKLERGEQIKPPAPSEIPLPVKDRQTRVKMTTIRRRTAERLVSAKQNAAHLTTFNEVDMERIVHIREQHRESFEKKYGVRLGFMSFFVKTCCAALSVYPEVNAYIEGDEIVYNNFYDIGIAVSVERGLLVPVLRDADKMSFAEIETTIKDFAERARNKKLSIDNLQGGTFTITNGGVFGSLLSTPIPNPPQTAILGMHAIQKRPIVVADEVVVRPMMYVALTYDHRLIDGREAVSFLVKMKELLEDPHRLLLEI